MGQTTDSIKFPVALLKDNRLTKTDLRMLMALHWLVSLGRDTISRAELAELIGIHPTKVSASTAHLKKLGLLDKQGGRFALIGQEVAKPATSSQTSYKKVAELATKRKPNQLQVAESATSPKVAESDSRTAEAREVIDHLNQVTQSAYTACESNAKHIRARLNDGMTVEDLKALTAHQAKLWLTDSKMRPYLRPQTLYGTKAQGYLSDARRNVAPLPYSKTTAKNLETLGRLFGESR